MIERRQYTYKNKHIDWVDDAPDDWSILRSDRYMTTIKKQVSPVFLKDKSVYHYSIPSVQDSSSGIIEPGGDIASSKQVVSETCLLVSKLNPRKSTSCIASPQKILTLCSSEFVVIRPLKSEIRFLAYVVKAEFYRQWLDSQVQSATKSHQRVSPDLIYKFVMAWPSLSDQEAIANHLDSKTSKIDKKIDLLRTKAEKYADLKQSLTAETVTRGLDKSVPMKESGVDWIGKMPKHWDSIRTKNVFDERGQLSSTGKETLLTVSHLTGVTPRSEKNVNMFMAESMVGYKLCKEGDLIINTMWAWMGALGTSRYSGICSPAYNVYFPRKGVPYCHRYFDYLFRTRNFIVEMTRNSRGIVSSRLRLYPKDFYQIQTLLPPEKEQEEIADYLDEKIGAIDKIIAVINSQIEKLVELRKTLINDVVTGKIKVA